MLITTNFLSFCYVSGTMLKSLQKLFNFHNPILQLGELKPRQNT